MFDSGSTRSLVSKETLDKHLGKQVADEVVKKDGYMPYFELADKSVVQGLGQATLQFLIAGKPFTHTFFVLKECSQDVILGNDFMLAKEACLNYRTGKLILHNENGETVISSFGLTEKCETPSLYSILYARKNITLPPFMYGGVEVECASKSVLRERKVWGFCSVLPKSILTPNGVAEINHGSSIAWVTNNSSRTITVKKGDPVCSFMEADRSAYDLFAVDLETMQHVNLEEKYAQHWRDQQCTCIQLEGLSTLATSERKCEASTSEGTLIDPGKNLENPPCTAQRCTTEHCTAQHNNQQHSTAQRTSTAQHSTAQGNGSQEHLGRLVPEKANVGLAPQTERVRLAPQREEKNPGVL